MSYTKYKSMSDWMNIIQKNKSEQLKRNLDHEHMKNEKLKYFYIGQDHSHKQHKRDFANSLYDLDKYKKELGIIRNVDPFMKSVNNRTNDKNIVKNYKSDLKKEQTQDKKDIALKGAESDDDYEKLAENALKSVANGKQLNTHTKKMQKLNIKEAFDEAPKFKTSEAAIRYFKHHDVPEVEDEDEEEEEIKTETKAETTPESGTESETESETETKNIDVSKLTEDQKNHTVYNIVTSKIIDQTFITDNKEDVETNQISTEDLKKYKKHYNAYVKKYKTLMELYKSNEKYKDNITKLEQEKDSIQKIYSDSLKQRQNEIVENAKNPFFGNTPFDEKREMKNLKIIDDYIGNNINEIKKEEHFKDISDQEKHKYFVQYEKNITTSYNNAIEYYLDAIKLTEKLYKKTNNTLYNNNKEKYKLELDRIKEKQQQEKEYIKNIQEFIKKQQKTSLNVNFDEIDELFQEEEKKKKEAEERNKNLENINENLKSIIKTEPEITPEEKEKEEKEKKEKEEKEKKEKEEKEERKKREKEREERKKERELKNEPMKLFNNVNDLLAKDKNGNNEWSMKQLEDEIKHLNKYRDDPEEEHTEKEKESLNKKIDMVKEAIAIRRVEEYKKIKKDKKYDLLTLRINDEIENEQIRVINPQEELKKAISLDEFEDVIKVIEYCAKNQITGFKNPEENNPLKYVDYIFDSYDLENRTLEQKFINICDNIDKSNRREFILKMCDLLHINIVAGGGGLRQDKTLYPDIIKQLKKVDERQIIKDVKKIQKRK